ncbi:MAG: DUF3788 domain-containing protein [Bacteroidetes bacterium]|nr:DUF3788 domain-containing protein [Bacteroidota bacterium]
MSPNLFLDKAKQPTPALLASALTSKGKCWDELKRHIQKRHGPVVEEWKYYGKSIGWTMKLLLGRRNLLFFTACDGYFAVSFVFGDKAVSAVQHSTLPKELIEQLVNARKYAEGRGIRIEVRSQRALRQVVGLVDIKAVN